MSLQERLETIRSASVPQNEESAKIRIVLPILRNLEWDPDDPEQVLYEHPVGAKGGGRVDIALKNSDRIVVLIEAKAPGADLRSHVGQVLGYAFHEGVDICVLTTGLEWWLYLPRESGPPSERRFAALKVTEDPVEQLLEDFNAFLGKEMLVSGQAERRAKAVRKASLEAAQLNKEIPNIWKGMLREPDDELVELLSKRVYDKVNLRPTKPQVSAALLGAPIPSAEPPATEPPPNPPESPSARRPTVKPTAIKLWGQRIPIRNHFEIVLAVAERLHERHPADFHQICEIEGRKGAYVARSPEGMHASRPIGRSGYFVNVHASGEALKKRATTFLEHFGYDSSDLKVLYD